MLLVTKSGGLNNKPTNPLKFIEYLTKAVLDHNHAGISLLLDIILKTNNVSVLKRVFITCHHRLFGFYVLITVLIIIQCKRTVRKAVNVLNHLLLHRIVNVQLVFASFVDYCKLVKRANLSTAVHATTRLFGNPGKILARQVLLLCPAVLTVAGPRTRTRATNKRPRTSFSRAHKKPFPYVNTWRSCTNMYFHNNGMNIW